MSYIDFLKFCLDNNKEFPVSANNIDWRKMLVWAEQQAIIGVCFLGIEKTKRSKIDISFDDLMEWIGNAQVIENQNRKLNRKCVEVVKEYKKSDMDIMVLKGQGNAQLYPNPLLRTSGDIDILVVGNERDTLTKYVKTNKSITGHHYHHIEYEEDGVQIEVHFIPCSMSNPLFHHRLQKWYKKMADGGRLKEEVELPEGVGAIPVPTVEFNIIFQLAHMMHHFFDEGIGLRQFVDYYFVLMAADFTDYADNKGIGDTLRFLGLWKFAGAVMYVMKEVFALDEKYMIAPVDERRGKTLMEEILKGGNFGQHSGLTKHSTGGKYFAKTWRNMQLVKEYPAEALCEPLFRTWHFFWRMAH